MGKRKHYTQSGDARIVVNIKNFKKCGNDIKCFREFPVEQENVAFNSSSNTNVIPINDFQCPCDMLYP